MRHLRALMESRPFLSRIPDQGLLVGDPGRGDEHLQATRGEGYAFIYTPRGRPFTVKLGPIAAQRVKAWWFDPRTGAAQDGGEFAAGGQHEFVPPARGPDRDWVLVLDDAAQARARPGRARGERSASAL